MATHARGRSPEPDERTAADRDVPGEAPGDVPGAAVRGKDAAGGAVAVVRTAPGVPGPPGLPGGARVWTFDAGPGAEPDLSALDEGELRRHARFLRPADRIRYGVAHAALRRLLGELTGAAPAALRFGRRACPRCGGPHGRPVLEHPAGGPEFSLSHGGGLVLVAVAPGRVGVDVEPVPGTPPDPGLVERLHPAERAVVRAAPEELRSAAFTRLWTRKEAYLKGLGVGLGRALDADDVSTAVPGWHLVDLAPGNGHAGALAVERAGAGDTAGDIRGSGTGFP